jgi:hypothetical protein
MEYVLLLRFVWMHRNDIWNWIEWEFQIQGGKEMAYNSNSTVWMACIVMLESGVAPISNSCLDVQAMELDVFY